MSEDRPWWPDDYDLPAFRVRRGTYGSMEGGDYVRGSTVELPSDGTVMTVPHTAVRYPTGSLDLSLIAPEMRGRLFVKASDASESDLYTTMAIQWDWPQAVVDTFEEMSIVRSAYGAPAFPEQGQTIFRAKREFFQVDEQGALMPPQILYDYLMPTKVKRDGLWVNGLVPNGRWYYYTAFFRTNPIDWTPIMSDSGVLPGNYRHSEHLWNAIPPYYQYTDENQGHQFLANFLGIFGYELDRTRQFVESVLDLHRIDVVPMQLLRNLGSNYGYKYEAGLGDVLYRGMMANISHLLTMRGTAKALLGIVETVSKYDCDLTNGVNSALLPDTSNFVYSIGQWKPIHPDVTVTILGSPVTGYLTWDKVKLSLVPREPGQTVGPPVAGAIGAMIVDTAIGDMDDVFITAGAGKDAVGETLPLYSGIPVRPGDTYGITLWVKMAAPGNVVLYLIPFDQDGGYTDFVPGDIDRHVASNVKVVPDTEWNQLDHLIEIPLGATYLVPGIYFMDRNMTGGVDGRSPEILVAAVMVYKIVSDLPVVLTPPSDYLTLGVSYMEIGAKTADDGTGESYDGFVIGGPVQGTPPPGEAP